MLTIIIGATLVCLGGIAAWMRWNARRKNYTSTNPEPKPEQRVIDYNEYFDNEEIDGVALERFYIGDLNLPSGKIVAGDPIVEIYDRPAFVKTVQPGKYPVIASIAKTKDWGDRYAVVKLEFNKNKAVKWELALAPGQSLKELEEEGGYFGYPVDAGLGCFCDEITQTEYGRFEEEYMKKNPQGNIYDDVLDALFQKNGNNWLNFSIPTKPELNVIMFHSGLGDGFYPCYWGLSADGNICSLIVDFQVLE